MMEVVIKFQSFVFQKEDKTVLKNKHGEFWLEVKNAVLFSVTQYEGYKDQHYICFHTSSVCMYHQGKPATRIYYILSMHCSSFMYFSFTDVFSLSLMSYSYPAQDLWMGAPLYQTSSCHAGHIPTGWNKPSTNQRRLLRDPQHPQRELVWRPAAWCLSLSKSHHKMQSAMSR